MVVSNGAVQTINATFVANVISKAVFSVKSKMNRLLYLLKTTKIHLSNYQQTVFVEK